MAEKLINITAPQYRCTWGACPSVYKSEDGKTFTIVGTIVASQISDKVGFGEEAVEIPADLLLSSLGVAELVEAAERVLAWQDPIEVCAPELGGCTSAFAALREALSSMKGGK